MKKLMAVCFVLVMFSCTKETVNSSTHDSVASSSRRNGGAEDNNPAAPSAVLTAFAAKFGNVPVREWRLRSNGDWRAHFTNNGVLWEATFTPAGVLVKSEPA
jgi:hypothetical protein